MHHAEFNRDVLPTCPEAAVGRSDAAAGQQPIAIRLNLFLVCVVFGGTLFQLYGMPLVLRGLGVRAVGLLLPIMLLQPLHWGLLHEGIHANLFPGRRANEFWARALSIMLGLPFDGTRFGHLVHHRFPRHGYDRPDVYDGRGSYALAWIGYRIRLLGGVYLSELVSPLVACVPASLGVRLMERAVPIMEQGDARIRRLYVSLVLNFPKRRRTRRAFAMTLALYGASAWAYGAWWPVLLGAMYARGLWHSLADNVPHHDVALDRPARARNYRVPPGVHLLLMNHNLHLTHHLYPRVPWTALAAVSLGEGERPTGNYFRAALGQANRMFPARA
jgi:fatty acid desaturase